MARVVLMAAVLLAVAIPTANVDPDSPSEALPRRLKSKHLPNLVLLHPRVISGGLPDGNDAFQELKSLGVKTIISVDGQKPEVEVATKFGMRYVHLPHGYDGIPSRRVKQLAKALRDLEGPIYIHCHYGKNRSPVAASVACVAARLLPPSQSMVPLALAGTSPDYRGLYQAARNASPMDQHLLDQFKAHFPATTEVPTLAEAMVAIEGTYENLQHIAAAGWRAPPNHPTLEPADEALLLHEHFVELLRTDAIKRRSADFKKLLQHSEAAALGLETTLRQWKPISPREEPPHAVRRFVDIISNNCTSCHQQFRDVPVGEK